MKVLRGTRIRKLMDRCYRKGYLDCQKIYKMEVNRLNHQMNLIQSSYLDQIDTINTQMEKEISKVREQERNFFETSVCERDIEISRLNKQADAKKHTYDEIRIQGQNLENLMDELADRFRRGQKKVTEGLQIIESTKDIIRNHNKHVVKKDGKIVSMLSVK